MAPEVAAIGELNKCEKRFEWYSNVLTNNIAGL